MTRVDLDYVQTRVDKAGDMRHGLVLLPIEDAQDMATELRAAREVVEAVRSPGAAYAPPPWKVREAMAAYDKAVGS